MLGMGWFPSTLGGLNRYYRSLFEQLPRARGVVIGPAEDAPPTIAAVANAQTPLPLRMARFWGAARAAARDSRVIDAHFALYALAPLLSGSLRGRPLVCHFHGPWAAESVAAGDSSGVRLRLRASLERRVLARADAVIVLSNAFRRVLAERYGLAPWHVHVWPPGVALESFADGDRAAARRELDLPPDAFVAVCVRRLVARMGIDGLLDAWAAAQLPQGSTLLIVGDGPLREHLRERADAAPLAGAVRVVGRLSDEQLVAAYRAADAAVVPTAALEGFGMVVLEAAACGTPSLVTDVGGLPEAAAGLDASLVVEAGDTQALARRIAAAAEGELPDRRATRAYAERFSWPAVAERHRELHRALLAGERDERVRVVYVDHVARLSGGEIALMRLLTRFRNVAPHVILGEDGPLAQRLQSMGVSVEVLALAPGARDVRRDRVRPGGASLASLWHTLAYVVRLRRRLRRLRPDIVHTNSLKAGVYGSIAARAAGIPVVWHVRDRIAEDYIPRPAVRLVRMLIGRLATGVIANSTATMQTVPASRREDRSWVIPASVEAQPAREARREGPVTFGMLGRIAPWKGQDLFLRAFAAAFLAGEERAVLVGAAMFGEEDFERELRDLARSLGIAERVEFRGFREDVWPELAAMDVLVHASVVPEPFGTVVLEGMAAGLAVLAADEGGPAEVIEDGRTGRLFASRDVDSLTGALRELAADPAERARLGASGREALHEYRPEAIAARLEEAYAAVLEARRRR